MVACLQWRQNSASHARLVWIVYLIHFRTGFALYSSLFHSRSFLYYEMHLLIYSELSAKSFPAHEWCMHFVRPTTKGGHLCLKPAAEKEKLIIPALGINYRA